MELRPNISAVLAISNSLSAANCLSQLTVRASVQWRIFLSPQLPIQNGSREQNHAPFRGDPSSVHFGIDCRSLLAVVGPNYNWWAVQYGRFLPRDSMLSAVYAVVVCLSVCMHSVCVCLSHSGIVSKRLNVESRK